MSILYERLDRAERLSDRVTERIQQLIAERALEPGERLPAERELCEAFGVSRTVIREAIRALVAKGLVVVQPGSGTVVRKPSASMVSDALSLVLRATSDGIRLRDLHEVRWIFEPEIAARAAERRTEDDLRAMREQLERMSPEYADWRAADVEFHAALARAAHNPIFRILLNSMQDMLREVRDLAFQLPDTRTTAIYHHTAIFEAVSAGDSAAARAAMEAHLRQAEIVMRRALAASRPNDTARDDTLWRRGRS